MMEGLTHRPFRRRSLDVLDFTCLQIYLKPLFSATGFPRSFLQFLLCVQLVPLKKSFSVQPYGCRILVERNTGP